VTLSRSVARLLAAWTLAALVILLAVPVGIRAEAAVTGLRFLVDFLTEGQWPWLARATPPPVVERLGNATAPGATPPDLWHPGGQGRRSWPGLVLVHGLTPEGKHDARLMFTADRLARAGFAVAVPELPELRAQRLRPEDARSVREAIVRLRAHPAVRPGPLSVIVVSVGLGPVALALDDPALATDVGVVLALGGYAEARELIRYFTTGAYAFGAISGRAPVDPALTAGFLARNVDLVSDARDRALILDVLEGHRTAADPSPAGRAVLALLQNREPERVDAFLAALPPETRQILDEMSPARRLAQARIRLLIVHGKDDPSIPYTESLRLAAAAPGRSRLVLVNLIGHVEGQAPTWHRLGDLVRLWSVSYELLAG
jgi:fermentation-respiration switch protein FrsA (DUF1100 family)